MQHPYLYLSGDENGSEGVGWQGASPFYFLWRREAPPAVSFDEGRLTVKRDDSEDATIFTHEDGG